MRRDFALVARCLVACCLAACTGEREPFGQTLPAGWKRVHPSFSGQVYDLLRDPSDSHMIYAACGWQTAGQAPASGGVLRSNDGGQSWLEANAGLPEHSAVLVLVAAPRGFAGADRGDLILAGTRHAGIHASSDNGVSWRPLGRGDDAPEWSRFTVQNLVALEEPSPAIAAGTDSQGVLVSEDGVSWNQRNNGLPSRNIKALTLTSDGVLLAGTWYGGLYASRSRGHEWKLLTPDLRYATISAVAQDANATLWVGLQNAGLLARSTEASHFESQGPEALEGVRTIVTVGRRVMAGTSGHGVVFGSHGRKLATVNEGLAIPTVNAVLLDGDSLDSDSSGEILIGTSSGLYRALPPTLRFGPTFLSAGLGVLLLTGAVAVVYRSTTAKAALAVYRLGQVDPKDLPDHLNRTLARLAFDKKSGRAVLARLAGWLAQAGDEYHAILARVLRATAPVMEPIRSARSKADRAVLHKLADALDQRVAAFEKLVGKSASGEGNLDELQLFLGVRRSDPRALAQVVAQQDRLFAALLRAETPGHLAASHDEVREIAELSRQFPDIPFNDRRFLVDLRGVFEGLTPLHRLPNSEDQALFLGQSLARTLEAQEHLSSLGTAQPTFSLMIGGLALESVRQILATALQDLRQRAELVLELRSKVFTATHREVVVVLEIRNIGHGHGQNIEVRLQGDDRFFRSLQPRQSVRNLPRRKSAQLEFLIEPLLSDRVRLTFTLTYDDLERRNQSLEFADMVEFRQVESRSFRPLHPNPYVVGRPLTRSDIFIGRDETFSRIISNLEGTHQDNVVILVGHRRMGKTSILRRLSAHLSEIYLPVLIDLQGFLGAGEATFFRELTAALHDGLEDAEFQVHEPATSHFEVDPGMVFRRYLRDVRRVLGERKLLILLDEFEVIEERIRAGELTPRILPYLRSLMQHEMSVSFLFAGTHRLEELNGDYWSVLFNLAVYLQVGLLSQGDVTQLFTQPVAGCFEIDPLALTKVYLFTGGHPHFSQLLARELVDFRNRERLTYVTVQDVNTVAEAVADKGQLHIAYLWSEATRDERLLLLALERVLQREGIATVAAAHHYLSEHRVETEDLPAAVHALKRREILSDQGGLLSFRMGLLRLWMERHHDLESFLLSEGRNSPPGAVE